MPTSWLELEEASFTSPTRPLGTVWHAWPEMFIKSPFDQLKMLSVSPIACHSKGTKPSVTGNGLLMEPYLIFDFQQAAEDLQYSMGCPDTGLDALHERVHGYNISKPGSYPVANP